MGFRAAGLGMITFSDVEVPVANIVGKAGFGFSHVAPVGLHWGRISTACHALGMLRGCVEESVAYAARRKIGEQPIGEFGMIRTLIARMATDLQAATLVCMNACQSEDDHAAEAFEDAFTAKYFASRAAVSAASDAVQIQGAAGVHESSPTSMYYRSSKITEIIEGTTQIHEDLLGKAILGRSGTLHQSGGRDMTDSEVSALRRPRTTCAASRLSTIRRRNSRTSRRSANCSRPGSRQCPDATAVLCEHDRTFGKPSLTYAELADKVEHLAASTCVPPERSPDDVVALMVERSFAMSIGILAIIRAGAAYLPLPPENPPDRTEYMLKEAGVAMLLVHGKTAAKGGGVQGHRDPNLDDLALYDGPRAPLANVNGPQDLAYVIYTSGSTGRPKGVMIEHRP